MQSKLYELTVPTRPVPHDQSTVMCLFGTILWGLAIGLLVLMIIVFLLRQKPTLIFDKYPSKGGLYYLKYYIALLLLRNLRRKLYPVKENEKLEQFDEPQELESNPQSYDVVSFMGANEHSEKLILTLERRRRGVIKACLYLWLPDEGLYCSPTLPDMVYFTTNGDEENPEFRGAGIHIYPEERMRQWCVHYDGELLQVSTGKLLKTKIDLKFSSSVAYFFYNRDLSVSVIADSVAREAWNDTFFGMLKCVDQILARRTHYDQNGFLEGIIRLGEQEFEIHLKAFRDRSFGTERCLSTINRYVYFALFLDDGTNMIVGNLSQPSFFLSSLKVGYICTPSRGVYRPITNCNFELYSYGEKGSPPKHQNFVVETSENKFFVQIQEQDSALRYLGGEWESKVFNQFVTCTVNGVKGNGITEYLYRHEGGRPETVSSNDPEWYQKVRKFERSLSSEELKENGNEIFIF